MPYEDIDSGKPIKVLIIILTSLGFQNVFPSGKFCFHCPFIRLGIGICQNELSKLLNSVLMFVLDQL